MKSNAKIRKEVLTFRESIKKVVVMLSGRNIPVAERGSRAFVEYDKKSGNPVMVSLPCIPDDASDGLMNAIRGFLDHEVAHLLYTDSSLAFSLLSAKDSPAFHLWNAVEDTFIERRMGEVFAGSKRNLINTQRHIIEKVFIPQSKNAMKALAGNQRDLFLKFLLTPALRAWAGQTPFVEFMEPLWDAILEPVAKLEKAGIPDAVPKLMSTEDCVKLAARISLVLREEMEKPEPMPSLGEPSEKCDEKDSTDKVGSEPPTEKHKEPDSDAADTELENEEEQEPAPVNNSNEDNIKEEEEGAEPQNEESEPNHSDPENESEVEEPQPTPDAVSDIAQEGEPTPDDDFTPDESAPPRFDDYEPDDAEADTSLEHLFGDGEPTEADLDNEDEATSAVSDDETNEPEEPTSEDAQEASKNTSTTADAGTGDIPLDEALKALENADTAPESGMEEALNEVMADELIGIGKSAYRPFQRTYDYLGPIDGAESFIRHTHETFGSLDMYGSISKYRIDSVGTALFSSNVESHLSDGASATLAKDLERAIASKNKVQFIPGQRRGKVHSANLYRLSMNDDRVFRKKEDHKAVNACVQQVIDLSGSMSDEKIALALACAYTIADALDRINVPNIITGFTTAGRDTGAMYKHDKSYNRYEALMLPTVKGWHERVNTPLARQRIGCLSDKFPLENNVDGESIMALAQHFSGRTEDKKIMIVLSDGLPQAVGHDFNAHLRSVATSIEESGLIELLAVGILTTAPKNFYKNSVVVNNVSELGATVVKALSRLILG